MAKEQRKVWFFICERCHYDWQPKDPKIEPRNCPQCKSPYWNTPRTIETANPAKSRKRK
jgi:predicted Zn-ribbon and HTH transcriptional regulator